MRIYGYANGLIKGASALDVLHITEVKEKELVSESKVAGVFELKVTLRPFGRSENWAEVWQTYIEITGLVPLGA